MLESEAMAATIRDVAAKAGVSVATVSFVLNDTKPITPATRQRVETAIADLGYHRNVVARALANRRTRIIALVCPFGAGSTGPTSREFFLGAARAANEQDHHLVIWPVSNDGAELAALVSEKLVDGILLMGVQLDDPRVEVLRTLHTPFALIGRTRDPADLTYVDIDMTASVRLALQHLTELGHRRITFVGGDQEQAETAGFGPYARGEQAYLALSAEFGVEPALLHSKQGLRSGPNAADELLRLAPGTTAAIVADEEVPAGMVFELGRRGRSVPGDISVMSVFSSADVARMCNPPLTTVTAPGGELGRLGVESLLQLLDGHPPAPALRTGDLVVGESTGPVRR